MSLCSVVIISSRIPKYIPYWIFDQPVSGRVALWVMSASGFWKGMKICGIKPDSEEFTHCIYTSVTRYSENIQRNKLTWLTRECVYMHCSNLVVVKLQVLAASHSLDSSPPTGVKIKDSVVTPLLSMMCVSEQSDALRRQTEQSFSSRCECVWV